MDGQTYSELFKAILRTWFKCSTRSSFSFFEYMLPLGTVTMTIWLWSEFHPERDTTFNVLYRHPLVGSFFVLLNSQTFVLKFLCIRSFGCRVVPIYRSMFNKDVAWFFLFIALNFMNACFMYATIPIHLYDGSKQDSSFIAVFEPAFQVFLHMFRLIFSGDFDEGDFTGMNPQIDLTKNGTKIQGELNNAPEAPFWHLGVSMLYIIFTLVINLGFLNVFIGLLSKKFDENDAQRKALFEEFRLVYTVKFLCLRNAWYLQRSRPDSCLNKLAGYFEKSIDAAANPDTTEHEDKIVWIAYSR